MYRAYQNEKPILIGGRGITGFVQHRGSIVKADLTALGLKEKYFRQLIFDGRRQHLARWPNYDPQNPYGGGWAYVDGKLVSMYQDIPGENRHTLIFKAADAREWSRPTDGEVFVFTRYNWWNNIVPIKTIDREKQQITLAGDASYPIRPGDRYYVRNLLEELDAPGEWYLDRETWTLYFWPPQTSEVSQTSKVSWAGATTHCTSSDGQKNVSGSFSTRSLTAVTEANKALVPNGTAASAFVPEVSISSTSHDVASSGVSARNTLS